MLCPGTPFALLTALALASACMPAATRSARRPSVPNPGSLPRVAAAPLAMGTIESVEYAGTGCEEGSTATSDLSPDKQVVTSTFSDRSSPPLTRTKRSRAGHPQLHRDHAGGCARPAGRIRSRAWTTVVSSAWNRT